MDITREFVDEMRDIAKAYDAEGDMSRRVALGAKLDGMAGRLTDKQIPQVVKMMMR